MITAKDVLNRMQAAGKISDREFDDFLENIIIPKFEYQQTHLIKLASSLFGESVLFAGKTPHQVVNAFTSRGFRMEFKCDDRPSGECYFDLELPSGAE